MIIKPYSALATESQNLSDFPCVTHFFPCDEAAGATTISDAAGDIVIASGVLTKPNANSVQLPVTTTLATTGTAVAASGKLVVALAVAEFAGTAGFRIGAAASNINLKTTNPLLTTNAGGESCLSTTFTLATAATVYGRAFVVNAYNTASTGFQTYEFNTTSTATALAATSSDVTGTPSGPVNDFTGVATGAGGFQFNTAAPIYGVAVFYFTTIPANLKAGLAWMTYQWSIGNKVIYPGWKGLS